MLVTASYKTAAIQQFTSHSTNYPTKTNKTCWPLARKIRANLIATFSSGLQYIDTLVLSDQQKIANLNNK